MAIQKRSSNKWKVSFEHEGRRYTRVVTGNKNDARLELARFRLEVAEQREATLQAPEFSSFCLNEYKRHCVATLHPNTWNKVRRYQVKNLILHFGHRRLSTITAKDVEALKFQLLERMGRGGVNEYLKVLGTIFSYAVELGYDLKPPETKPMRHKPKQGRVQVWTQDEALAVLDSFAQVAPEMLPLVTFLINTGCRPGEALALRWDCVDLINGMIRIQPSQEWQPKNGKAREIPIGPGLRPVLLRLADETLSSYVFPNPEGGRYKTVPRKGWDRAIAHAWKHHGVTGTPYVCRHTFASHFLQACPDMFLLGEVMGHSHQRVTKIYAHLLPGHLEKARGAVNILPRVAPEVAPAQNRQPLKIA